MHEADEKKGGLAIAQYANFLEKKKIKFNIIPGPNMFLTLPFGDFLQ